MSKMPLLWHKESYKHMRQYADTLRARFEALQKDVTRTEAACDYLHWQIAKAERMGKDGFDAERFGVKRSK